MHALILEFTLFTEKLNNIYNLLGFYGNCMREKVHNFVRYHHHYTIFHVFKNVHSQSNTHIEREII